MVFWEFDVPKHVGVCVTPRLTHTSCVHVINMCNQWCM